MTGKTFLVKNNLHLNKMSDRNKTTLSRKSKKCQSCLDINFIPNKSSDLKVMVKTLIY